MLKALSKQLPDMDVIKRIVGNLPLLPILNEIKIPQDAKLMRNGRLGFAQQKSDVTDAQFVLREGIEDLRPGGVSKNLECLSQFLYDPVRLHYFADCINLLLVDTENFARIFFVSKHHFLRL